MPREDSGFVLINSLFHLDKTECVKLGHESKTYIERRIERFLIECRKTKTNVITRTNRRKKTPSRGNKRKKKKKLPMREKTRVLFCN